MKAFNYINVALGVVALILLVILLMQIFKVLTGVSNTSNNLEKVNNNLEKIENKIDRIIESYNHSGKTIVAMFTIVSILKILKSIVKTGRKITTKKISQALAIAKSVKTVTELVKK